MDSHLCWYCRRCEPPPGKRTCEECTIKNRENQRRRRERLANVGLCVHCGKRRTRGGLKTCKRCQTESGVHKKIVHEGRREEGLCPFCGKPPKPGYVHCEFHLEFFRAKARSERRVRTHRVDRTIAERVTRYRQRMRAQNRCGKCGEPAAWSPKLQRFVLFCERHMYLARERSARRRKTKLGKKRAKKPRP